MQTLTEAMQQTMHSMRAAVRDDMIVLPTGAAIGFRPPEYATGSQTPVALASAAVRVAAEHALQRTKIVEDTRRSLEAKEEDIAALDAQFAEQISRAVADVEAHAAAMEQTYTANIAPPRIEPTDAAAALLDREMRDYVRGLSLADALAAVQRSAALAESVLRSPIPMPDPVMEMATTTRLAQLRNSPNYESLERGKELAAWSRQVASHAKVAVGRANRQGLVPR